MFAKTILVFSAAAVLAGSSAALAMTQISVRVGASAPQSVSAQDLRRNNLPAYAVSGRVHPLSPSGAPGFRQTPVFAPDAPPPRSYSNPGLPDFQNGSAGIRHKHR